MKFVFIFAILMAACSEDGFIQLDPDSGTDSDGDSDSNADAGTDSGTDGDYIDTDCSDVDQICDTPPADHCSADQTTVINYSGDATCTDGVCNYSTNTEVCDYKCVEYGPEHRPVYCIPEVCEGIICDHHDSNATHQTDGNFYCNGDNALLEVESIGTCTSDGADGAYCHYFPISADIPCPNSCVEVEDGDDYCI